MMEHIKAGIRDSISVCITMMSMIISVTFFRHECGYGLTFGLVYSLFGVVFGAGFALREKPCPWSKTWIWYLSFVMALGFAGALTCVVAIGFKFGLSNGIIDGLCFLVSIPCILLGSVLGFWISLIFKAKLGRVIYIKDVEGIFLDWTITSFLCKARDRFFHNGEIVAVISLKDERCVVGVQDDVAEPDLISERSAPDDGWDREWRLTALTYGRPVVTATTHDAMPSQSAGRWNWRFQLGMPDSSVRGLRKISWSLQPTLPAK